MDRDKALLLLGCICLVASAILCILSGTLMYHIPMGISGIFVGSYISLGIIGAILVYKYGYVVLWW